ncbi:cytosolic sulfotransferase 11-like [Camellia sinensis]|uniref:cytosolic sulfotransferase 11-like n=1 Tax=Camellia sinensis TaxID=4442 RepID=UPI001035C9B2|nr:cytosolic sulfotransferase 11-like [Camellia sinensis]
MATNAQGSDEETSFLNDSRKVEWRPGTILVYWKGFWLMLDLIKSIMIVENQFKPLPSDILLASYPKTGTTWLKALAVSIISHNSKAWISPEGDAQADLLQTHNPHELIPFLEMETFGENSSQNINKVLSPWVFSTHLPYSILLEHMFGASISFEGAFDEFCRGIVPEGPFFDHVLEYWKEREKKNVFFVTYEELKENPKESVRSLVEFLRCSMTSEEIEQVVWKSSHERLSKLDVNIDEVKGIWLGIPFNLYFRKGVVGDGKNQLTTEMMERLEALENQRWEGSGLKLKLSIANPNIKLMDKI